MTIDPSALRLPQNNDAFVVESTLVVYLPAAVAHLTNAYRTARKLGARPLANRIAQALESLGEPIVEHLGQGSAARFLSGNLTRRQREILQIVAQWQTNAEIARALLLSPRAEAARRAAELGLLESTTSA